MRHPSESEEWSELSKEERIKMHRLYQNELKKIKERERRKQAKEKISFDWNLKPRPISEVGKCQPFIAVGEQFSSRQLIEMRISEVCNFLSKRPRYSRSILDKSSEHGRKDSQSICARAHAAEDNFIIKASLKNDIWVVSEVEGLLKTFLSDINTKNSRKCAFTAQQLAPILLDLNESCLSLTYRTIRSFLKNYVLEDCLSKGLIEEIKIICVKKVLGISSENVKFLFSLESELEKNNFIVEMGTCDNSVMEDILLDGVHAQHRLSENKKPKPERERFNRAQWKNENKEFLQKSLGDEKTDFFCISYLPLKTLKYSQKIA